MIGNSLHKMTAKTGRFLVVTGFATVLTLSTAYAGFDWVPPTGTNVPEPVTSAPVPPVLDHLESVISEPVPVAPGLTVLPPVEAVPVEMSPNIRSATRPDRFYDNVQGFGDGLPLAMALGQIVPPDYSYSFAQGVDPGIRVSWEGGRPWNEVLIDMMAPHGFEPAIVDKTVVVRVAAVPRVPAMLPAPAPMTPVAAPVAPPVPTAAPALSPAKVLPVPAPYRSHEMINGSTTKDGVLDPRSVASWEGYPGSSLKRVLENWSTQANVKLYWRSPYDYPLNTAFRIQGTYPEAVEAILSAYSASVPSPAGKLHPNLPYGPSVLIVE